MEFLFPEYRLDWFGAGPSSPNKTGALLAIVFVAAWWPALRYRWGFWLSLPVAFVAAGLLLQTESRGAIVGAFVGSVALFSVVRFSVGSYRRTLAKASRYVFSLRGFTLLVALSVLALYSHQLGVNERMTAMTSGEDGSSNVRVGLYSAGLQMIAAAPLGWGSGQAGDAYGQWYQEIGDGRSYLSLVNSHLTWMAEGGMLFQFFYIAGWVLVLLLCWPVDATRSAGSEPAAGVASPRGVGAVGARGMGEGGSGRVGWPPEGGHLRLVAFGSWVALGVCGVFSSVLTLPWLWVLPGLLLLLCVGQRLRMRAWPGRRVWCIGSLIVLIGFVGLHAVARGFAGDPKIAANRGRIEVGQTLGSVAIVQPDRAILGDKYGHTIREYLGEIGGFTVLRESVNAVDLAGFDTVVLSGGADISELREFQGKVVWMNPPADVDEAALEGLGERSLTVVVGSLGDWRRSRVWVSLAEEHPNWKLKELRGVADFIPAWPKHLEPFPLSPKATADK